MRPSLDSGCEYRYVAELIFQSISRLEQSKPNRPTNGGSNTWKEPPIMSNHLRRSCSQANSSLSTSNRNRWWLLRMLFHVLLPGNEQ